MARFDVYANPGAHANSTPYLLDVQSDLLNGLGTRMVIPLRSLNQFPKVRLSTRLTPVFDIAGMPCILETPKMGAVPQRVLTSPIASLSDVRGEITAALDFLLQGY